MKTMQDANKIVNTCSTLQNNNKKAMQSFKSAGAISMPDLPSLHFSSTVQVLS